MKKLKNYFVDSFRELNHVTWPTQKQAVRITAIVVGFIIVTALFLGVTDYFFSYVYTYLISIA